MKSKIQDLLNDKNSVLVFDVDGVLAPIEHDEYYSDEEWLKEIESGKDFYKDIRPFKTMQEFLKGKNKDNIYVITKVVDNKEFLQKQAFLEKNYNIKEDNCYMVFKDRDRLLLLEEIKEYYQDLDNHHIVFIDDNIDNLNYIRNNSNYSTVHISSFMK